MPVSEFTLLKRFATSGDAEAFAEIAREHASLVYGVCMRILADKDMAADVVQDTFLQLVRNADSITGSLPNWLHRVAKNRSIELIRQDSSRKHHEKTYAADSQKNQSQEEKVAWQEISGCIDEELDKLDELTREVLILHFFESQTMAAIAEKFGISQPTVSRRIESGIDSLRQKLKSRGVLVSAAILTALLIENSVQAVPASILKELGKIALAGSKATIGVKIATGLAVKTKIMVGVLIVLLGAGLTVVSSFIANGENKPTNTWDLVRNSLRNGASTEPNSNKDVPSDINQLLSKFSQAREKTKSFIIDSNAEIKFEYVDNRRNVSFSGTMYTKSSLKYDGNRKKTTSYVWGNINPDQPNVVENEADYSSGLWDGKRKYSYTGHGDMDSPGYLITNKIEDGETNTAVQDQKEFSGQYMGYARGDDKSIVELIKENPSQVKLSEKPENIRGVDCFVIDAVLKGHGQYHIWIDPEHDYHIVKMQVTRSENDIAFGNKLEKGNIDKETYEVFSFEKYGEIWFPKEYKTFSDTNTYGNPRTDERTTRITKALFNPDHDALGSFKPDDIPDGAEVDILHAVDGRTVSFDGEYTWKNGKVIDSYGYEVNLSNLKQSSLMGKTLPSLAEFGVNLEPDVFKNNRLLICFFDYSQSPSKNCVLTLNEKTQSLLDKDIFLIFIQAESANNQTLAAWLKQNNIVLPVGTSKIDLPALGHRWGVQSLPWLILTDKNHIVTEEGFPIAELDEKIKALMER